MKAMMKRMSLLFMTLCIVSMAFAITSCDKDKPVHFEQLPQAARTFLMTHFPDIEMVYADKDWDGYEVLLSNGTELEFSSKGQWTKAETRQELIPESVLKLLPENLTSYISQTYPDRNIKMVEIKRFGYEIELHGLHDLELKFDSKGQFLYIDD
jgi:Protein of unknown function (DUF2874).